jgi:uncharacterized protein YecT (DUF1311 family)
MVLLAVAPAFGADSGGVDARAPAGRWSGHCSWGTAISHNREDYRLIRALGADKLEVIAWMEGEDVPPGGGFVVLAGPTETVVQRTDGMTFKGGSATLQFSLAKGSLEILPAESDDACQGMGGDYTLTKDAEFGEFRPSFDCARAKQPRERAICASPELAFLDQWLSLAYRAAEWRVKSSGASAAIAKDRLRQLRADQNAWFSKTLTACQGADCVPPIYRERIKELEAIEPRGR